MDRELSRRRLLQAGAGGLLIELAGPGRAMAERLLARLGAANMVKDVVRKQDMLVLRFEFYNLRLVAGTRLETIGGGPGVVVVCFAPQHIGERAFFESSGSDNEQPEPAPIENRLAAESRLAFTLPDSALPMPFRLENLLAWQDWTQRVVPSATIGPIRPGFPKPALNEPHDDETSLEMPYRLQISPNVTAGWAHSTDPVVRDDRHELWHTRLGKRVNSDSGWVVDEQDASTRTVRAIWTRSPEFNRTSPPSPNQIEPFRHSLTNNRRWQLVRLTADFNATDYAPTPVSVDRLMLTALGGYFDGRGFWNTDAIPDPNLTVTEWRHRMALGRDTYVRVVEVGNLFPLRHKAVKIVVTERKFQRDSTGGPIGAYLRQREFIVVRQPVVKYPDGPAPSDGRNWPFVEARITTTVTPNLETATHPAAVIKIGPEVWGEHAYWPVVGSSPFLFNVVFTDHDGQVSECAMPLIFVSKTRRQDPIYMGNLSNEYNTNAVRQDRRTRAFGGQMVAFAPSDTPGDTTLEVKQLVLKAGSGFLSVDVDDPRFWPALDTAHVRLQAVEQIKGSGLGGTTVRMHPAYVDDRPNPAGLFVKLVDATPLEFDQSDRSGGLVTPNLEITALSRRGPVGGAAGDPPANNPPTQFDPDTFFKDANLLGIIRLADVIQPADFSEMPKLNARTYYPGDNPKRPPTKVETTLEWTPVLKAVPEFEPLDGASFVVTARSVQPLDPPGEPSMQVVAEMRKVRLNLAGSDPFLKLEFSRIRFESEKGSKTKVDVDISHVQFLNELSFVDRLKELLPDKGTGPTIDVTGNGVVVTTGVNVPSIPAGVINIYNLAFSGSVVLPFDGTPMSVRFAFCTKDDPFVIAYTIFGGGGYAEIELDAKGVKTVLLSLQAGVYAEMDFGIASGSISAAFGIEMTISEDDLSLTGFFRFHGEVEALGLITISITLELEMRYEDASVTGCATLTVEVDLTLISVTKSVQVEKRLSGGGSGGSGSSGGKALGRAVAASPEIAFEDLMDAAAWTEYAGEFDALAFG